MRDAHPAINGAGRALIHYDAGNLSGHVSPFGRGKTKNAAKDDENNRGFPYSGKNIFGRKR